MYVYIKSNAGYLVGFYDPKGNWILESTHYSKEAAATRVNYLNGGTDTDTINAAALYIGNR